MLSRDELRKAYDEVDTDKSGSIELGELVALCEKLGEPTDLGTVSTLFQEIDTNHDGKVSFTEFVAWFRLGKHSKLKGALKAACLADSWYNSKLKDKFLAKKGAEMGETIDLVNIEISEGEPQDTTHYHWHFTTNADDEELVGILDAAFPELGASNSEGRMLACMLQRSTDAAAYAEAMRGVMDAFMDMALEAIPEEMHPMVQMMKPLVGHAQDWLVVAHNVNQNPMLAAYAEMAQGMLSQFPTDALQATFDLKAFGSNDCSQLLHLEDWSKMNTEGAGLIINLNVSEAGKIFATEMMREFVPPSPSPMMQAEDLACLFDGISLKLKTNKGNGASQDLTAHMNQFKAMAQQQMSAPIPEMDVHWEKFKNWEACKQELQPHADKHREMMKEYYDCPALNDMFDAVRKYGLAEGRWSVVAGTLQGGMRVKFGGLGEILEAGLKLVKGE